MADEYGDKEAIMEMEKFFDEVDSFAKMFSTPSSPWDLDNLKKEVAVIWFPQFKQAYNEGKVDLTWGTNPNYAFVKWCWQNLVKFKEGIINDRSPT